jgi:hypothetical protein
MTLLRGMQIPTLGMPTAGYLPLSYLQELAVNAGEPMERWGQRVRAAGLAYETTAIQGSHPHRLPISPRQWCRSDRNGTPGVYRSVGSSQGEWRSFPVFEQSW